MRLDELKQKVMETLSDINKSWAEAINKAEEEGIDLTKMIEKNDEARNQLDKYFLIAQNNLVKGGLFYKPKQPNEEVEKILEKLEKGVDKILNKARE